MKIDATNKRELLEHIDALRSFIEHLDDDRDCKSCINWDQGCKVSGGIMPPPEVQEKGCKSWVVFDEIPF
jgi:hypothetical protein